MIDGLLCHLPVPQSAERVGEHHPAFLTDPAPSARLLCWCGCGEDRKRSLYSLGFISIPKNKSTKQSQTTGVHVKIYHIFVV